MTKEEAIIDIRESIQPIVGGKSLDIAIYAIKKQIPKKVNISLKGTTGWNTKCHCPNCYSMVSHGKYCSNCGQALDFNSNGSDTNE